jgi:hypothetical protein
VTSIKKLIKTAAPKKAILEKAEQTWYCCRIKYKRTIGFPPKNTHFSVSAESILTYRREIYRMGLYIRGAEFRGLTRADWAGTHTGCPIKHGIHVKISVS